MARKQYLKHFDSPDVLNRIEAGRLMTLIQDHADFFAGHGYELPSDPADLDVQQLAILLLEPQPDTPSELVDALTHIHEVVTNNNIGLLIEQARSAGVDVPRGDDYSAEDVAVMIWLEQPGLLRRYHAEHVVLRRRAFVTYMLDEDAVLVRPGSLVEPLHALSDAVGTWYRDEYDRGEGAHVIPFDTERELRLVVPHGAPYKREGCFEEGSPSSVAFRPMQFAYAVLDWEAWELRVNADTKGQLDMLRQFVGSYLFAQPDMFCEREKYTLDPFREGRRSLVCTDVPGLDRVTLTSLVMGFGGPYGRKRIEKADDLLLALEREGESIPDRADLLDARLEFVFSGSRKPRPVHVSRGNRATYTRSSDALVIEDFLQKRGLSREVRRRVASA